jgi:hypothetical protein
MERGEREKERRDGIGRGGGGGDLVSIFIMMGFINEGLRLLSCYALFGIFFGHCYARLLKIFF